MPNSRHVEDRSGRLRWLCDDCLPPKLADGSHQGKVVTVQHRNTGDNTYYPLTDFADHTGVNAAREIEIATARAEGAIEVVRCLVQAFERELAHSYATVEQQQALRRARALIAEARKR